MSPEAAQKLVDFGMGMMAASARPGPLGAAIASGYGAMNDASKARLQEEMLKQQMEGQRQIVQMRSGEIQRLQQQQQAIQNAPAAIRDAVAIGVPVQDAWKNQNPALPQGMRYNNETGQVEIVPGFIDMKKQIGKAADPYYQFLPTANGYMAGNARTGEATPVFGADGKPIVKASDDPSLQGRISWGKTYGKEKGENAAQSELALPKLEAQAEETIGLVNDLLKHPGFGMAVGKSSMLQVQKIPGTDAHDFMLRLDQLKGKQFLQAFESLKGGGAITEMEGKKATDAISRMNNTASEEEFATAAREFQQVIRLGLERARKGASNPEAGITGPLMTEKSMRDSMGTIPPESPATIANNPAEIRKELSKTTDANIRKILQSELNKYVVKRGVYGGRPVVQYSDGSVDYAN
jgi:hypothetical protein